jgi:hypothetical protein
MVLNVKKANINSDTAIPINSICLPDREARIA